MRLLGRRVDGYHALESLVAFAAVPSDRLTLDPARPRAVTVTGPFAGGIAGANLIETVFDLVALAEPRARLGHITLEKYLPIAAGIGGGSADAAAALRLLRRLNPDLAPGIEWPAIARRLGADVPVCLFDQPANMSGTGERLEPVETLPATDVVLANPMVPVPADKTAQVFRALAAPPLASGPAVSKPPPRLTGRMELLRRVQGGNDLEPAARKVVPAIGTVLDALRALPECRVAAMSGAGPTCFGLFDDARAAAAAAADLTRAEPGWWVQATVLE
ncbi:MAG: 4-(cytidine 5'-diphospho)-2-C-methyl-D-erythritol kinase [Hyphomicrobiaceae bacterium]